MGAQGPFVVNDQVPGRELTRGGGFSNVWTIHYTAMPSGVYDSVTVPDTSHTTDEVNRVLTTRAARLNVIAALPGVTGLSKSRDIAPGGSWAEKWTVYFKSARNGVQGFVEIPDTQMDPDYVSAMIDEKSGTVDAIHELGG